MEKPKTRRKKVGTVTHPVPIVECPTCGHERPDPDWMTREEIAGIRGLIGVRLGWEGPLPFPRWARLISSTHRSVMYYEHGERVVPRLIAREARRLRDLPVAELRKLQPVSWQKARSIVARRRIASRRREEQKKAKLPPQNLPI